MLIALVIICWYISGVASYLYWWTSKYDFTSKEVNLALFLGLCGPITYVMCWYVMGIKITVVKNVKTLLKKRT